MYNKPMNKDLTYHSGVVKFKIVFRVILLLTFTRLVISDVISSDYKAVFNDGLSKMEMIEQIDLYLNNDLNQKLKKMSEEIKKANDSHNDIKKLIKKMNDRIEEIDKNISDNMSKGKGSSDSTATQEAVYLRNLKASVIPSIQQKLRNNERKMNDFIKQMTANLEVNNSIKKALDEGSRREQ